MLFARVDPVLALYQNDSRALLQRRRRVDRYIVGEYFGTCQPGPRVVDLVLMMSPEQEESLALEALKLLYQLTQSSPARPSMHDIFKGPSVLKRRKMLYAFQYRLKNVQAEDYSTLLSEVFTDVMGEVSWIDSLSLALAPIYISQTCLGGVHV